MDVILSNVRQKFVEKSKQIVEFRKPWTPWALVALLNIDDSQTDLPAELILYAALQKKRTRLGITITTTVQVLENNALFRVVTKILFVSSGEVRPRAAQAKHAISGWSRIPRQTPTILHGTCRFHRPRDRQTPCDIRADGQFC